jgi:hypothetical protein
MSKRNKEKRTKRSFATTKEAIVSIFDDPAVVHLDSGGALTILTHEGILKMIDLLARDKGATRDVILITILVGEEMEMSRPV